MPGRYGLGFGRWNMRLRRFLLCGLLLIPLFLSGCVLDTMMDDFVNAGPKAVIDATPVEGEAPLTVTFDAHYSRDPDGSIVSYRWEFGDPTDRDTCHESACTHTYQNAGTYIATLTTIDDEGLTDSQQIAVIVGNPAPVADFLISNTSPYPGDEVYFNAAGSHDLDGEIVSYQWDFGDGATSGGVTTAHTYTEGGYYVVTLTLTDDLGATAMTMSGLNVLPGQSKCADDTTCGGGAPTPIAIISTSPNLTSCGGSSIEINQPIMFDGRFSKVESGQIVSYAWDFGDGTHVSGPQYTHTYTTLGTHHVTLTVVSSDGISNTASAYVRVELAGGSTCP